MRRDLAGVIQEWAQEYANHGITLPPKSIKEGHLIEAIEKVAWRHSTMVLLMMADNLNVQLVQREEEDGPEERAQQTDGQGVGGDPASPD